MIVRCQSCLWYFDDEFRDTICPHAAFPANDGKNNFEVRDDAYLSEVPPPTRPSGWRDDFGRTAEEAVDEV